MADGFQTSLGVLLGGGLTIASGWLADVRLTARERERRRVERDERLADKRNELQRESLLALQTASQCLVRSAGQILHHDLIESRRVARWVKTPVSDPLSEENLRIHTDVMLLSTRILDDEVRTLSDSLRTAVIESEMSRSEDEAMGAMTKVSKTQSELLSRIGVLIRAMESSQV